MSMKEYKTYNLENKKLIRMQLKSIRAGLKADVKLVKELRKSLIKNKTSKYVKAEINSKVDALQKSDLVELFCPIEVINEDEAVEAIANKIDETETRIIILSKDINYLTSLIRSEQKSKQRIKEENKQMKIKKNMSVSVKVSLDEFLDDILEDLSGGCGFEKPEEEK